MDFETWEGRFRPVDNHIDANASFDGKMYETFGLEYDFVAAQPPERVWTYVDDGDDVAIVHGIHYVNRVGYFVTEEPGTEEVYVDLNA